MGSRGNPKPGLKDSSSLGLESDGAGGKEGLAVNGGRLALSLFKSCSVLFNWASPWHHPPQVQMQGRNTPCPGRLGAPSPGRGEGADYSDAFRSHTPPPQLVDIHHPQGLISHSD